MAGWQIASELYPASLILVPRLPTIPQSWGVRIPTWRGRSQAAKTCGRQSVPFLTRRLRDGRQPRRGLHRAEESGGAETSISPSWRLGTRKCEHGVILKVVSTNICGSDQHMVRGRTTAPPGLVLGHEITGEVIECGRDVEFIKRGRPGVGAVQHRLRPLPQLQGGEDRHLPERQSGPAGRRLRLRRHGRLGGRPGPVRHGALRRLQPAEVPRPRSGHGQDPRPDAACPTSSRPATTAP